MYCINPVKIAGVCVLMISLIMASNHVGDFTVD